MNKINPAALQDILKLFVLSAKHENCSPERTYLDFFLSVFSQEKGNAQLIGQFESQLQELSLGDPAKARKISMKDSVQALHLSKSLSNVLSYEQKVAVAVFMMEQARTDQDFSPERFGLASTVANVLGLEKAYISFLSQFLTLSEAFALQDPSLLYVTGENLPVMQIVLEVNHLKAPDLKGVVVFSVVSPKLLLCRSLHPGNVAVSGHKINNKKCYTCLPGDYIKMNEEGVLAARIAEQVGSTSHPRVVFIPRTKTTMEVKLDPFTGDLSFSGTSVPGDVMDFFQPLLLWLDNFILSCPPKITVHFHLDFFNTISSKLFLTLLKRVEKSVSEKTIAQVKWYYEDGDEDIMEAGENYAFIIRVPFEMIAVHGDKIVSTTITSGLGYN